MYEKRKRQEKQGQLHMLSIDDLVPKNHILRLNVYPIFVIIRSNSSKLSACFTA